MTVTRELSMVYGGVTMGGSNAATLNLDGYPSLSFHRGNDAIVASVVFDVIVKGTSDADMKTQANKLEAEFLKPYLRFRWIHGSSTFIDWNPSTDSGFNAEPTCELIGGPPDSGRARKYRCSVAVQLPADNNSGRVSASIDVQYDSSDRRTVIGSATYTAQSGTAALANAQSLFPTFMGTILTALGGTYDKLGTGTFTRDDQDKTCEASISYREIKYNQSTSGADHAAVVDHEVTFSLSEVGPGYTPGGQWGAPKFLAGISANYACNVLFGSTTDLSALWKNTLRPYVLAQAKTIFGASIVSVSENNPNFDKTSNTISCSLNMTAVMQGATVYAYNVTQTRREVHPALIVDAYDGTPAGAYVYEDKQIVERTTTITAIFADIRGIQKVKGWKLAEGEIDKDGRLPSPDAEGWIMQETSPQYRPSTLGIPGLGTPIPTTEFSQMIRERWVTKPGQAGGVITPRGDGAAGVGR